VTPRYGLLLVVAGVVLALGRLTPSLAQDPATSRPGQDPGPTSAVVYHFDRSPGQAWSVAETAHFCIFHHLPRGQAERAAQAAERTRAAAFRKWFGDVRPAWNPRCQLYLHATADDYRRETGVPAHSPGHSTIGREGGRVVRRRIDLHCDHPDMLTAVLPHETTHVVVAGEFAGPRVPPWADEGMAVLAEPAEQINGYLRHLPACCRQGQLFGVDELLSLQDYPGRRLTLAFYAQSVSLVQFLAREKGPRTFARFVREGMEGGYEQALRKYFGWDFAGLRQHWQHFAFSPADAARGP
jgi:peptidase MA superfamily protein